MPIGLRVGIRGGLERWYGDVYVAAICHAGGLGSISYDSGNNMIDLRKGNFMAGLDVGFGRDR